MYLTVNYHTQQFQLAPVVSGNGLTSDLVSFDTSAGVGCPVDHSVSGGDIGVIVVGSTLAIVLIVILFFWFYKWRHAWSEMKTKKLPADVLSTVGRLKENVQNLTGRVEALEEIERPQPIRYEMPEGHRGSNASSELPSPSSAGGERGHLDSLISAAIEESV